jgi:glycosyltransferase involved in cell wall biosynthesis
MRWGSSASPRRRLLVFLPTFSRGGAEEYGLQLAQEAKATGWEVCVAVPLGEVGRELGRSLDRAGVRWTAARIAEGVDLLDRSKRRHGKRLAASLGVLFRERPCVALHVLPLPWFGLGTTLACAGVGVPGVAFFAGVHGPLTLNPRHASALRWARSRGLRSVAVCEENARHLAPALGVPTQEVQVIRSGPLHLPLSGDARAAARAATRAWLGVGDGAPLIVTVARLVEGKGYQHYVDALPSILQAQPDARFAWVGDGPWRGHLEALLAERGVASSVDFLGRPELHARQSGVPQLLAAADLFVLPSLYEGSPISIAEALSAGVPVVASRVGGIPEVIDHGVEGRLCAPADPGDLAREVSVALADADALAAMGAAAARRAESFSRERCLGAMLELLDQTRKR